MKIPFDIKFRPQIESGKYKVETRDGKPVRIICWDRKCGYPICGLAYDRETEREYYVNARENGMKTLDEMMKLSGDLFIITPEPELSEFEKGCIRLYQEGRDDGLAGENLSDEILKESAAELLDLARKELTLSGNIVLSVEEFEKKYVEAMNKGKAEALKGLPRWIDDGLPKGSAVIDIGGLYGCDFIRRHGKLLRISDLEKLPKDE